MVTGSRLVRRGDDKRLGYRTVQRGVVTVLGISASRWDWGRYVYVDELTRSARTRVMRTASVVVLDLAESRRNHVATQTIKA